MSSEPKQEIPQGLLIYFGSLLEQKGADKLTPSIRAELIYDLYLRFNDYLLVNVARELSETDVEKLDKLMQSDAEPKKIYDYLEKTTNFSEVLKNTMDEFSGIFLKTNKK